MKELGIWIEREFRVRVASKGYWVFTVICTVLLVALTFLPSFFRWVDRVTTDQVILDDPKQLVAPALIQTVSPHSDAFNFRLSAVQTPGLDHYSRTRLRSYMQQHHAKALVLVQGQDAAHASFVIAQNGSVDPTEVQSLRALLEEQVTQARVAGLPADVRAKLAAPVSVEIHQLQVGSKSMDQLIQSKILVYFMLIILFATLTLYGAWVAQGVAEEKSNRIIEMMLITSRPWQILFGKVIGIALVGLLQYAVWFVVIAAAAWLGPSITDLSLHSISFSTGVWFPIFFLIGYLMWATLYGIAGSMVTRAEEQQMAITPVVILMVVCFYLALFGVLPNPDSTLAKVVSLLPMLSPLTMPARIALSSVPGWQVAVALALDVAFTVLLVAWGARVYRRFALRNSGRASWRLVLWPRRTSSLDGDI
jgi:ABC-2 type transport system permease protein